MLKFDVLTKIRKWLTTSKDVSTEGKWFADAKSISDLWKNVKRTSGSRGWTANTEQTIDTFTCTESGWYYLQLYAIGSISSYILLQIYNSEKYNANTPELMYGRTIVSHSYGSPSAVVSCIAELASGDTVDFTGYCSVSNTSNDRQWHVKVFKIK